MPKQDPAPKTQKPEVVRGVKNGRTGGSISGVVRSNSLSSHSSGKTRQTASSGSQGKSAGTAVKAKSRSADWAAQQRTVFLLDNFGGVTKLAGALDVSKSQPSRWKTGEEVPGPEAASRLLDLDYVFAFAMQAWDPAVVTDWLESPNGFLDNARPIDVLRQRGSGEVIDALRATISGGYA